MHEMLIALRNSPSIKTISNVDMTYVNWDDDEMVIEFGHFVAEATSLTKVWMYGNTGSR